MKGRLLMAALLMLGACSKSAPSDPNNDPKAGPPPPPPYQMRAQLPAGDRLIAGRDGEALFSNRCGACHLAGGMGTNLLTKQRMLAGEPPERGMLTNRDDLTSDYVRSVVRNGKVAMPRLSRTEVTDAELDAIATFLGKNGK